MLCSIKNIYAVIMLSICLLCERTAFSQAKPGQDTVLKKADISLPDSLHINFRRSDTSVAVLGQKIEHVTRIISEANSILHRGFDTNEIAKELPALENFVNNYAPSVLNKQGLINLRYIKTLKSFLLQCQSRLEDWQSTLHGYAKEMMDINNNLNTIIHDSAFHNLPEDSTLRVLYMKQLIALNARWQAADSSNNANLQKINLLQNRVTNTSLLANQAVDEIVYIEKNFQRLLWSAEEPAIWNIRKEQYKLSFWEMNGYSFSVIDKVISNFFLLSVSQTIKVILLMLAIYLWVAISLRRIRLNHGQANDVAAKAPNISKSPFWLICLLLFTTLPFVYRDPPPSFIMLLFVAAATIYTVIKYKAIAKWLQKYWLVFFIIFLAVNYATLLLRPTYVERWGLFAMNIIALSVGFIFLRTSKQPKNELDKYVVPLVILFIVLSFASLIANIIGCFSLSKYFMISAVYSVMSARIFFYLVQVIVEVTYIQYEAYKHIRAIGRFDFNKIKNNLARFLTVLSVIMWTYLLLRNLNFYDAAYDAVSDFFSTERKIGNASFSFGSIFIFILVIWLSTVISRLIITIVGLSTENISGSRKSKWGSFLLLARLAILGAGVLLAFAASGIPLDKLTIIIGALGVGIGFGLQNIVNNLVSGIILAFERPVHVGDAIEVGNRFGTVKEIGIRSSKLTTIEGSEVIVPNGDLISQHIVNWTLNDQYRRVEIIIGVDYETKLQEATSVIKDILCRQKGVQRYPAPLVLVHNFNASAVDIRLLFWSDINDWVLIKSEVMIKVFDAFREHNIRIPFPQQDVHIKSSDNKPVNVAVENEEKQAK